jgi:hypothetical protein
MSLRPHLIGIAIASRRDTDIQRGKATTPNAARCLGIGHLALHAAWRSRSRESLTRRIATASLGPQRSYCVLTFGGRSHW